MDLVSFDTPGEFKMFEEIMARGEAMSSDLYQLVLNVSQTYPPVRERNPRVVFKVADDGCSRAV